MDAAVIQKPWSNLKTLCERNHNCKVVSNRPPDLDSGGEESIDLAEKQEKNLYSTCSGVATSQLFDLLIHNQSWAFLGKLLQPQKLSLDLLLITPRIISSLVWKHLLIRPPGGAILSLISIFHHSAAKWMHIFLFLALFWWSEKMITMMMNNKLKTCPSARCSESRNLLLHLTHLRIPTTLRRGYATSPTARPTPWHSQTAIRTGSPATTAIALSSAGSATRS